MSSEELLETLHEDGSKTGKIVPRSEVHKKGLWDMASHTWVYSPDGYILLQLRSKDIGNYPGRWDVSSAGHVSAGDTYEAAAVREVAEELGVSLSLDEFEFWVARKIEKPTPGWEHPHRQFLRYYFVCLPRNTKFTLQQEELDGIKWVTIEEFRRLIQDSEMYKTFVPHGKSFYLKVADEVLERLKKQTAK